MTEATRVVRSHAADRTELDGPLFSVGLPTGGKPQSLVAESAIRFCNLELLRILFPCFPNKQLRHDIYVANLVVTDSCTYPGGFVVNATTIAILDQCESFSGEISFDPNYANTDPSPIISKCTILNGNLILSGPFASFTFQNLGTINGSLEISSLSGVSGSVQLSFPSLENIDTLQISNFLLPNFELGTPETSPLKDIRTLEISDNDVLTSVSIPVPEIGNLNISNNKVNPDIYFPNLITAGNISASGIRGFEAPQLLTVSGNFSFYATNFTNLNLPSLRSVGASLNLTSQYGLNNLTLPNLESVGKSIAGSSSIDGGDFVIQNSAFLTNISLPSLSDVEGDLEFSGEIEACVYHPVEKKTSTTLLTWKQIIDAKSYFSQKCNGHPSRHSVDR